MSIVSEEGIAKINATSTLVLKKRGDSAVQFYNAANRLYVMRFIELADIGGHRVLYFMFRLVEGQRGGPADKETGRMMVAVITQYLEEHPDDLVCFCHYDHDKTNAIHRIHLLWARTNRDLIDGKGAYFDGAGHDGENRGLHFMVMYNLKCKDLAALKTFILENSDEFACTVREQMNLFHQKEEELFEIRNK